MTGPRAIRYARGNEKEALAALGCTGNLFDKIDTRPGAKVALVSYGAESEEIIAATDLLLQKKVAADAYKLTRIFPLPEGLCEALADYDTILFAEDAIRTGGHRPAAGLCPAAGRLAGKIPAARCR